MFRVKTQNLVDFPFEEYAEPQTTPQLLQLAQTHRLSNYNSWMMPQILAYFGSWQLVYRDDKTVDHRATAQRNMTTRWAVGVWRVCTQLKRSALVHQQNHPDMCNYSQLVPIILAAHKRYANIPYSRWDLDETTTLVDPKLREAMFYRNPDIFSLGSAELLELRERGLTSVKAGTSLSATHQWCLRGMQGTALAGAPALVGTMLTQIWVAHPSLRTPLMILDPLNWDRMPDPLLTDQIFVAKPPVESRPSQQSLPLPWEV